MIGKAGLPVIDELGYVPVDEEGSRLLFQVAANAYERQSVIFTTNIEFSGWGRVFGDPNMAAAIIDRTVHHGRMIRFDGDSYRRTHALMEQPHTTTKQTGGRNPVLKWTNSCRSLGPKQHAQTDHFNLTKHIQDSHRSPSLDDMTQDERDEITRRINGTPLEVSAGSHRRGHGANRWNDSPPKGHSSQGTPYD